MSYYYHTTDLDSKLCHSHYSDPMLDTPGGISIFGRNESGLQWDYADRLYQWNPDKFDQIESILREKYQGLRCARRIQDLLSMYYDRPIELVCILSGTQQFNGYPWYAYGYRFLDEPR